MSKQKTQTITFSTAAKETNFINFLEFIFSNTLTWGQIHYVSRRWERSRLRTQSFPCWVRRASELSQLENLQSRVLYPQFYFDRYLWDPETCLWWDLAVGTWKDVSRPHTFISKRSPWKFYVAIFERLDIGWNILISNNWDLFLQQRIFTITSVRILKVAPDYVWFVGNSCIACRNMFVKNRFVNRWFTNW